MNEYEVGSGIWYATEFNSIKKSKDQLRPIYEAFTNSWEVLQETKRSDAFIYIDVYRKSELIADSFDRIVVEDNGCGLNEENYDRLKTLRKDTKGKLNKGTGRVQYLHFFNKTKIESVYEKDNSKYKRIIELSKSDEFLYKPAFIKKVSDAPTDEDVRTKVIFSDLLDEKDVEFYEHLTIDAIKEKIVMHYIVLLCQNRNSLPKIILRLFKDEKEQQSLTIEQSDIPNLDREENFKVHYSTIENNEIVTLQKEESFCLRSFKIPQENLLENSLRLISKDEVLEKKLSLPIPEKDSIEGFRYLFFVSGDYLDKNDSDTRGTIHLCSEKELKKSAREDDLFNDECITIDSLNKSTQRIVEKNYPVFNEKKQKKFLDVNELKEMFLLDDAIVEDIKSSISLDANDEDILSKIYKSESKKIANVDAKIAETKKNVEKLDPASDDYVDALKMAAEELTKQIPMQNKNELSKYVARRKIVLDVFQKILDKELESLKEKDHVDEEVLHNLLFRQHTNTPNESDLWLINEEYMLFKGNSEYSLDQLEINGVKVLKDELSEEELAYKMKCQQNAGLKRPDILLFPNEGKCLIIELKAPHVKVSEHLNQILQYASLLHNLSKPEFKFNFFYGYLIGENIDTYDVRDYDSDYKAAPHLNYLYRINKEVVDRFGNRGPGNLYTEVIKYSVLLERAKMRNQIFIEKLTGKDL